MRIKATLLAVSVAMLFFGVAIALCHITWTNETLWTAFNKFFGGNANAEPGSLSELFGSWRGIFPILSSIALGAAVYFSCGEETAEEEML